LKKESDVNIIEEVLNPIHRIWNEPATLDPITYLPNFIIDRVTIHDEIKNEHFLVINQNNLKQIPKSYYKKISRESYTKHTIKETRDLNNLINKCYKKAIIKNYQAIQKKFDFIVIESYADQALLKWEGLKKFETVIATEPWQIIKYDPIKYEKALQILKPLNSWEVSTRKLTDLLKPVKKVHLNAVKPNKLVKYLKNKVSLIMRV
jgi:predicted P-loop ATPase/GTPase